MKTPEEWMTIKTLKKNGFKQRGIASDLGISRHTVKRHLIGEHPALPTQEAFSTHRGSP